MSKKNLIMFMPTIETGGVEKNFIIIANFFADKFKNTTIVTTSKNRRSEFSKKIRFVTQNFFKTHNKNRRLKFLVGLLILFREILSNRKSVVFSFQANIYCILLCKILNTEIIVRSNSSPTGWSNNFFKKFLYKKILKMADQIMVNSLEFKKIFKDKFNINAKCIYNPLNKDVIINQSKKKINFNFFKNKTINFINVSRFEDQKDHYTLLKSFAKINFEYKLLLIGDGSNKLKIKNIIKNNKLTKKIKIISNISNPFPYIKKSDVLILTSIFEGLPNILLEAITLKKLIISSDCPTGPKEILDNGKGGLLFKHGNYKDLFEKIIFLEKNLKNLNSKTKFAHKRLYRFDSKDVLNKYFYFVNKLLKIKS
jgi:glycosyltransferase involved in cell wall biosynthesis